MKLSMSFILLAFPAIIFGQEIESDYLELNRKELRIEHQNKLIELNLTKDSLNSLKLFTNDKLKELERANNLNESLNKEVKKTLIELEASEKKLKEESDRFESNIKKLNGELAILNDANRILSDSVQKLILQYTDSISLMQSELNGLSSTLSLKESEIAALQETLSNQKNSATNKPNDKSFWVNVPNLESLLGIFTDDCANLSEWSDRIEITKIMICIGPECEYGGTIKKVEFDLISGSFKLTFINDNDMAGDGSLNTLLFFHYDNYISFLNYENEMTVFRKCR